MCWACYTPLSGGVTASTSASNGPVGTMGAMDEKSRKAPIPMWQIGVLGLAVVVGLGFLATSLMGGSTSGNDSPTYGPIANSTVGTTTTRPSFTGSANTSPSIGAPPAVVPAAPITATGEVRFTMSLPPTRGIPWGTMAIVPTDGAASQDAAGLAATAARQMSRTGRWDGLDVYVFGDAEAAQRFAQHQRLTNGAALGPDDYNSMRDLWPSALLCYQYSNGNESIRYPARNPDGWWNVKPKYARSRS